MSYRTNVVYRYDGTFEGFLSCVFESFQCKEIPLHILPPDREQEMLLPSREITTDPHKAERVYRSIERKMSEEAKELIELSFLTCLPDKEKYMLDFFYLGYHYGRRVLNHLSNDTVNTLLKAVKHLTNEGSHLTGFIRFTQRNGVLVSIIEPKNLVLPIIKSHFAHRYPNERFLIFDRAHGMALIHTHKQCGIVPVEEIELGEISREEQYYQDLWRMFYDTIAIESRYNPQCRMSHMPKRFWAYMTEFQEPETSTFRLAQPTIHLSAERGTNAPPTTGSVQITAEKYR